MSQDVWSNVAKNKIVDPSVLCQKVAFLREERKKIATLNGSFDLLHAGHMHIIYEASKQSDVLIVALNSDDSIKKYKSLQRPIIALAYRLEMVAALQFVDYVTWFEELDPRKVLSVIKPDVHVNEEKYGLDCIESETVKRYGGKIHLVSHVPGLSTTKILQKIHKMQKEDNKQCV